MKIILTLIFFLALTTSVYFFGKLITWVAYKINPSSFKKEITQRDILVYNLTGFFSVILWSILYYFSL